MPQFNPGGFRHQVDVYLPSTTLDARGRRTGEPLLILQALPCSIEQLQALELIRAQKVWAEATHRVRCYQDPANPLTERHYLLFGLVTLQIGAVVDADNTGIEVELLCKEDRAQVSPGGAPLTSQLPAVISLENGSITRRKANLTATAPPTSGDDSADGYVVGSLWWDVAADRIYVCADATAGAAVWQRFDSEELRHASTEGYVYTFVGRAELDTAETAETWTIARFSVDDGAVVTEHATGAWTDRETLSYE